MVNSVKFQLDTAYRRCWTDLNQVTNLKIPTGELYPSFQLEYHLWVLPTLLCPMPLLLEVDHITFSVWLRKSVLHINTQKIDSHTFSFFSSSLIS